MTSIPPIGAAGGTRSTRPEPPGTDGFWGLAGSQFMTRRFSLAATPYRTHQRGAHELEIHANEHEGHDQMGGGSDRDRLADGRAGHPRRVHGAEHHSTGPRSLRGGA